MPEIHVVAILSPKPGKAERLLTLLQPLLQTVQTTEPQTLRYLMLQEPTTSSSSETTSEQDIVFIEKYASPEANETHVQGEKFQQVFRAIAEEGLLAREMVLRKGLVVVGGFEGR
ncbi:hypothetical protein M409DRAFT_20945 [Zasmidium cellare ATCC 36951]|uniref:ABM domain-containing protein n=1 Tax=Zasmidium cellare ATCC 36951 TaxID=1080233 RepID=A0A6A6CT30_ZASCE|nr:uncharacterized protein M409DRAFT_20945 [Zasmidium cellare ATCC 36951]KAF2168929.1 hypothetical protein M409DRAFT_20945 [Zasmidium cellare ATCC 36951]